MIEFTLPQKIEKHILHCQEAGLSRLLQFMYTVIYETVCEKNGIVEFEEFSENKTDLSINRSQMVLIRDR